jgi:hypothetical protein
MAERKQADKKANEKKSEKEPKLRVRDLKVSKDPKAGLTPPDDIKPPIIP